MCRQDGRQGEAERAAEAKCSFAEAMSCISSLSGSPYSVSIESMIPFTIHFFSRFIRLNMSLAIVYKKVSKRTKLKNNV